MDNELEIIRRNLGESPRRIGFFGFGWGGRLMPVPKQLRGYTADEEPMLDTFTRQKEIWRRGRIIWGYVVMANRDLYLEGDVDLPGDVVYSLTATDREALEHLPEIADTLFDAKVSKKEAADFPQDEQPIVEHLRLETDRAFGLSVPASMSRGLNCHVSTFWAHRDFLPGRALGLKFVPLLVLAQIAHDALIIPACYWPTSLTIPWEQRVKERMARLRYSRERIESQETWKAQIQKNGAPSTWLEARPEDVIGGWLGVFEVEMPGDHGLGLVSLLTKQEWQLRADGGCSIKHTGQLLENGEVLDDAPVFHIEQNGSFSVESGQLVAVWNDEKESSSRLTVVSSGELFDGDQFWLRRLHQPSHEERGIEKTAGGSTVYKHKPRADTGIVPPDMSDSNLQAIDDHIIEHIGNIDTVWHEIVSDIVHIDVHVVAPTPERPYYTLITSGMSDLPMSAPEGANDQQFAELMICLPPDWKLKQEDFRDECNYWPIRWLKTLARFPHEYETWLWSAHTIPNGDPAEPLADNTSFIGFMLARPMTTSVEFHELLVPPLKTIHFHSLIPLTSAEMDFKLQHGANALIDRFENAKVTELLDIHRKSVV